MYVYIIFGLCLKNRWILSLSFFHSSSIISVDSIESGQFDKHNLLLRSRLVSSFGHALLRLNHICK